MIFNKERISQFISLAKEYYDFNHNFFSKKDSCSDELYGTFSCCDEHKQLNQLGDNLKKEASLLLKVMDISETSPNWWYCFTNVFFDILTNDERNFCLSLSKSYEKDLISTEEELIEVITKIKDENKKGMYVWLQPYGNDVYEPSIGSNSFFVSSEDSCYLIDTNTDPKELAKEMIFAYNGQYKTMIN